MSDTAKAAERRIVRFHNPYHPNDGHGPGVTLPQHIYHYLMSLDGTVGEVREEISTISSAWPGAVIQDHGDSIGIVQFTTAERGMFAPSHHWRGIGYEVLSIENVATINALAADIRRVDGNHDLGAGELAERLIAAGWMKAVAAPQTEKRA